MLLNVPDPYWLNAVTIRELHVVCVVNKLANHLKCVKNKYIMEH